MRHDKECDLNRKRTSVTRDATVEEIKAFFETHCDRVVTFVGYSDKGYETPHAMLDQASRVLREFDPANTIVNAGGTASGIGAVYGLAKQYGFVTTGIVSMQAKEAQAALSPDVDYVFFVPDASWGGYLPQTEQLSPTSTAMVEVSHIIIGMGGGAVARDELLAAKKLGKAVRFFPAEMNHAIVRAEANETGEPAPNDFLGAAHEVLERFDRA